MERLSIKNTETHILLFDGVCNLCNSVVQFIIKSDSKGKFKFASLQSESGQIWLNKLGLSKNDFTSIVFISQDKCFIRSSAVLQVLKELGGIWRLFYIFIIVPRPFRDFVYNLMAKSRYKIFGKRDTCMTPTPDIKLRFLS